MNKFEKDVKNAEIWDKKNKNVLEIGREKTVSIFFPYVPRGKSLWYNSRKSGYYQLVEKVFSTS